MIENLYNKNNNNINYKKLENNLKKNSILKIQTINNKNSNSIEQLKDYIKTDNLYQNLNIFEQEFIDNVIMNLMRDEKYDINLAKTVLSSILLGMKIQKEISKRYCSK